MILKTLVAATWERTKARAISAFSYYLFATAVTMLPTGRRGDVSKMKANPMLPRGFTIPFNVSEGADRPSQLDLRAEA